MNMKQYDLIIIGGGAAGLMAGITAKDKFENVLILEKEQKVGKKLKKTGSGRCNLTNLVQSPKFYYSDKELFTIHVLDNFSTRRTIQFFNQLGLFTENINDYIYPYTHEAKVVVELLRERFLEKGGILKCQEEVINLEKKEDLFNVTTNSWTYYSKRVLLTTGSKASIQDEKANPYSLATKLGHNVTPIYPTLVPLKSSDKELDSLAGLRHKGSVTYYRDEENILTFEGEIQFIAGGISGIPVFQISGDVIEDLENGKDIIIYLNLLPDFDKESIDLFLEHRIETLGKNISIQKLLMGLIHQKFIKVLLNRLNLSSNILVKSLSEDDNENLKLGLQHFPISITGYKGLEVSQAARGGVTTHEVNSITLESKIVKDLYFAGEVLAVDGLCGGYNLQWAWSSGYISGQCLKEPDYD